MVADILVAFVFSLMIELFGSMGKTMKRILIAVCCVTMIVAYFCAGNTINFIGTMDFGIWVLFVVVFNIMLNLLEQWLVRYFDNKKQQSKIC